MDYLDKPKVITETVRNIRINQRRQKRKTGEMWQKGKSETPSVRRFLCTLLVVRYKDQGQRQRGPSETRDSPQWTITNVMRTSELPPHQQYQHTHTHTDKLKMKNFNI